MTLENFELFVDGKIKDRGFNYYKDGDVLKVEQVGEKEFSAVVFGSSLYNVYVKIKDGEITESYCDCPYDFGNTCKHEVAVYYKIRKSEFIDTKEKIGEILGNLDDEMLRRFVNNLLKKDRDFRQNFLRKFDEDFEEDEFDEYEDY